VAVQDAAARIVAVLARAGALFGAPTEPQGAAGEANLVGPAAQTIRAIAERTSEMSGATAHGHGDFVAGSVEFLERASDSDVRLAESLRRSAQFHDSGRSQAAGLRATAADVHAQLQSWAGLPAVEAAGLKVLRAQLAGMHNLLARHRAAAARTATEIRKLRYRPDGDQPGRD
jgi:hypothetical protein